MACLDLPSFLRGQATRPCIQGSPLETCRELLGRSADLKASRFILPSQDFCELDAINVPTLQRGENTEAFVSGHDCQVPSECSGSLGLWLRPLPHFASAHSGYLQGDHSL